MVLRDVDITKTLDYSSAIAILGFSLIVSILRTFDVRVEAARVMVSPPVLAFVTSHIMYINLYKLDYDIQKIFVSFLKPILFFVLRILCEFNVYRLEHDCVCDHGSRSATAMGKMGGCLETSF